MVKVGNETIQAFPVTERTYVGTPNGYSSGGHVLHVVSATTITFDFGTRGIVVLDNLTPGQDFALDPDIQSITADGVCWIS